MSSGIYKITCNKTGKCYIGQSIDVERRWGQHRKKYSPELFSYEILLECDHDTFDFFETAFIDAYDSHRNGFNKTRGGTSIKVRFPHQSTRLKYSIAQSKRTGHLAAHWGRTHTDATKLQISTSVRESEAHQAARHLMAAAGARRTGELHHYFGKELSDDHKEKIRKKLLGRPSPMKGRTTSDETKLKLSEKQKGVPKPKTQCPHCLKYIANNMFDRWHGENCKLRQENN
jgi:group I intron endonuclease